jgi:ammonia channel protein AmtB
VLPATLPINVGNTAFMLLCASLVMLMTPGLAFFYGGGKFQTSCRLNVAFMRPFFVPGVAPFDQVFE